MIHLAGTWQMKCTKDNNWQEAIVPGTVYTDLLRNGNMDDPFWRENEYKIQELSNYDYEYMRTFTITEGDLTARQLVLVCEGLDTLAELYVNDTPIAKTNNMHRTYRFDIKPCLIAGENTIHIILRSPSEFIAKMDEKKPLWGVSSTVPGYQHIRKAHCMFGWDWGPKLPDLGIFRNIYIETIQDGRVKDFYVVQKHEENHVELTIDVENEFITAMGESADAPADHTLGVTLSLYAPDGKLLCQENRSAASSMSFTYTVNDPQLWWPNGYGSQPLYKVCVTLSKDGREISCKSGRIGLRTITMKRKKDRWGESFGFEINGIVIFAKGANYIPEDNLLGRKTPEKTRKLLEDCIATNFNCIRVWGGGNYPEDCFYDFCDELGLIVWQDFMFACAVYDLTDAFTANIKAEFEDNIRRLRNHASLGMWCGNNEMESAWLYWGLPDNKKLLQDYFTMFERIIPESLYKFDPETFYWPSSPSSGGGFDKTCEEGYGDAHYWDVWHGKKPFEDFENLYFRFASEYGFQSAPCMKTVKTFTEEGDLNMFSNVMENHQKCIDNGHGNVTLMTYLHNYYQNPKDFETTLYTTQILQADCLEIAVSHFRSNRGRCLGSTYWQLNDCNPVISWATIDYYGRWKASHYVVKRCYAPTIINLRKEEDEVTFYVSTERLEEANYTFSYQLIHQEKGVLDTGRAVVHMAPLSAKAVCTITLPRLNLEDSRNCYIAYSLNENDVETSSKVYLLAKPKQFYFKNPEIAATWEETDDAYTLTLTAKELARRTTVDFTHADVILSDNCVDLLPGKPITLSIAKSGLNDNITLDVLKNGLEIMSCYNITK